MSLNFVALSFFQRARHSGGINTQTHIGFCSVLEPFTDNWRAKRFIFKWLCWHYMVRANMTYNPNMLVGVDNRTHKSTFLTSRTFNFWIKSGFFFTPVDQPDCSSDLTWYNVTLQRGEWENEARVHTQTVREAISLLLTTKNLCDWSE